MNREDLLRIYDEAYADQYDQRWLTAPTHKQATDFELSILQKLVKKNTRWLDVGCGTGFFLSKFPGVSRAGMDLSPAMLDKARSANPDALFFQEGDFRNDVPEWHACWSLVSCMWTPYVYLDSIVEIEKFIANITAWTAVHGAIFLPVTDIEYLRPDTSISYEEDTIENGFVTGKTLITGIIWTFEQHDLGKVHRNSICPHVEHFVELLMPYFETIEILHYPSDLPEMGPRKAILAANRRANKCHDRSPRIIRSPDTHSTFKSSVNVVVDEQKRIEMAYNGITSRAMSTPTEELSEKVEAQPLSVPCASQASATFIHEGKNRLQRDRIIELYGPQYAIAYNQAWGENPEWSSEVSHHIDSLKKYINAETRWLDVGCGTGFFLSKFPGTIRAGLDLSPHMLEQARVANPDALFFREGDMSDDIIEFHDSWNLVTCTGQPYCYLPTMDDIERAAANLAKWTSPDGLCLVWPADLADLAKFAQKYHFTGESLIPKTLFITGVIFSYVGSSGEVHKNNIFPSLDVWVRWLSRYFKRLEIICWPKVSRFLIASQKRVEGDTAPTEIIENTMPYSDSETHDKPVPLLDLPLSYFISHFRPWRFQFWKAVFNIVKERAFSK